jgi:sec-independent protein translocase protein TatB
MLDIGWSELLVIAVILIVVVGPKDLPPMLRAFGKMTTRLRKTAGEFRAQFDDALRDADMDDLRKTIGDAQKLNPAHALREAMNPLRQMGADIKADLQRATQVDHFPLADASGISASDQPLVPMTDADFPPLGPIGNPDSSLFSPHGSGAGGGKRGGTGMGKAARSRRELIVTPSSVAHAGAKAASRSAVRRAFRKSDRT